MRGSAWCLAVLLLAAATAAQQDDALHFPGRPTRKPNRRPATRLGAPCTDCPAAQRQPGSPKRQVPSTTTTTTTAAPQIQQEEEPEIPLDFLKQLNDIDNERDFFALIDRENNHLANVSGLFEAAEPGEYHIRQNRGHEGDTTTLGLRIQNPDVLTDLREEFSVPYVHSADERRTNVIERPRQARCMPVNTTVPLKQDNSTEDPFVIYFPSCTRVQRCGGCCNSDLLSCQPTEIRLRSFQVITTEFKNGKFSDIRRSKIVDLEEHMRCTCDCRIKSEHCNSLQQYDERSCRCKCINNDDKAKCDGENGMKLWDYDQCLCKCREVSECSTGFYFDPQTCSCKSDTLIYSRFQNNPRQGSSYNQQLTPWEQVTGRRSPST